MLRPGRLETLLFVNLPNADERVDILQTLVRNLPVEVSDDLKALARSCEGFSGADLGSLLRRAGYSAIRRRDTIKFHDFVIAKENVRSSVADMKKYERLRMDWGSGGGGDTSL